MLPNLDYFEKARDGTPMYSTEAMKLIIMADKDEWLEIYRMNQLGEITSEAWYQFYYQHGKGYDKFLNTPYALSPDGKLPIFSRNPCGEVGLSSLPIPKKKNYKYILIRR